jgi:hypothetical protein
MSLLKWIAGGLLLAGGVALAAKPKARASSPARPAPLDRKPAPSRSAAPATPAGPLGVPGTSTGVPGYADKGEQTFGPDDSLTPLALGDQYDLDTRKALPEGTTLPPFVRLKVEGFRWVDGAYRYIVSNAMSPTLYGFIEAAVKQNVAMGTFRRV